MSLPQAFFMVHRGLDREGPGEAADVLWALEQAETPENARILDAACGPGADTVTLADVRPGARVLALDITPHFVEETRQRIARFGARVTAEEGSYLDLADTYDLIWCAGAVYFHGVQTVLNAWSPHLAPGGAVAFSEPAWMIEPPSDAAKRFWSGEYAPRTDSEIRDEIHAAGWGVLGQRWIVDAPWAAYYGPMSARLDRLEETEQSPDVTAAIRAAREEIANWQAAREEIAYSLYVVRRP